MKIYFDPLGQQIQTQVSGATCKIGITEPGERLKTFFNDIKAAFGANAYTIGKESDLSDCVYPTYDVLVLTNRINYTYDKETLANILTFVHSGGGLWCMSNHAGFEEGTFQLNDHVAFDSAVTTVFFTSLQAAAYGSKDPSNNKVILNGKNLYPHPTVTGQKGWPLAPSSNSTAVSSIVTRSFCGVYANSFTDTVAGLSGLDNVINQQNGDTVTPGVTWARAIDSDSSGNNGNTLAGKGRVVIGADAGWLGGKETVCPGPGEYPNGDNAQYALNTLCWLGKYTGDT